MFEAADSGSSREVVVKFTHRRNEEYTTFSQLTISLFNCIVVVVSSVGARWWLWTVLLEQTWWQQHAKIPHSVYGDVKVINLSPHGTVFWDLRLLDIICYPTDGHDGAKFIGLGYDAQTG